MFNFNFDRRTIYIIMGVLLVFAVAQYASEPARLLALLLTAPGVLIAITFHEYAHGYAAYKLGDDTAKNDGRLSLNPLMHLDPIGTIMLLVAGFGWGKPVEVDPRNYNRNISVEKADAIVSAAGPLMNFVLAIVFACIYCAMYKFAGAFIETQLGFILFAIVQYTVVVNVGLGIFNLIPLPPLDGSKVLMSFLPYNAKQWFQNNIMVFYIIFVIIFVTGIASSIISPAISAISNGILNLTGMLFGV